MTSKKLTTAACYQAACPAGKKSTDLPAGEGLYLRVFATGKKEWRYNYRHAGRQKTFTYGQFPTLSVSDARTRHAEQRERVRQGIDISAEKVAARHEAKARAEQELLAKMTFGVAIHQWMDYWVSLGRWKHMTEANRQRWLRGETVATRDKKTEGKNRDRIRRHLRPLFSKPLEALSSTEYENLFRSIRRPGEAATVLGYAKLAVAYATRHFDPELRSRLVDNINAVTLNRRSSKKNYPAVTDPRVFGLLVRDCLRAPAEMRTVVPAFLCQVYLTQRTGALLQMKWADVDLEGGTWYCPRSTIKLDNQSQLAAEELSRQGNMKGYHVVPLPPQVVQILNGLHPVTGRFRHVFSREDVDAPISDASLRSLIERAKWKGRQTPHSLRASAETVMGNHFVFDKDSWEIHLGHRVAKYSGAYDRRDLVEARRRILFDWARLVDHLVEGKPIAEFQPTYIQRRT